MLELMLCSPGAHAVGSEARGSYRSGSARPIARVRANAWIKCNVRRQPRCNAGARPTIRPGCQAFRRRPF
jgi:hypothetical protein